MRRKNTQSGFTLMEALLASAILLMAITAITMPFSTAAGTEQLVIRQTMAAGLAQELMEEILAKPFADPQGASNPGVEADEDEQDRGTFDNMDDYDGWEDLPGQIADMQGNLVNDEVAQQLSRHVTAGYVYVDGQDEGQPATFIRITVEVRYGQRALATFTRLACAYGT
jgi:MSHA pilin protein MshD